MLYFRFRNSIKKKLGRENFKYKIKRQYFFLSLSEIYSALSPEKFGKPQYAFPLRYHFSMLVLQVYLFFYT